MVEDRREIGTTYVFAPPRVFENLLTLTMVRMEDAERAQAADVQVFHRPREPRSARRSSTASRASACCDRLLYAARRLCWSTGRCKNRFGLTEHQVAYTAGEAIGPEIFRFYRAHRRQPEAALRPDRGRRSTSPCSPTARSAPTRSARPAPQVEIRIADNGEVLYRSPGVFLGYYKNPETTAETKTADGWVHTGDAGFFDQTGI